MPRKVKYCSACLNLDVKVVSLKSGLSKMFKQITSVEIPTVLLCWECNAMFLKCKQFVERCRRAETMILLLAANDCLNKEKLQLVDRKKLKLNSLLCRSKTTYINSSKADDIETEIKEEIGDFEEVGQEENNISEGEDTNLDNDQIFVETNEFDMQIGNHDSDPLKRQKRIRDKKKGLKINSQDNQLEVKHESILDNLIDSYDGEHLPDLITPLRNVKDKIVIKKQKKEKKRPLQKIKKKGRRRRLEEYVDIIEFTIEQQLAEMSKRRSVMEQSKASFKCNLCYKIFREEKTFNNHHRMEHHESIGPYVCDICKVRRKSKHKLYVHICSHLRAYICKQCGFQSKHGYQATMHKEYHDGKLYICEKCGRTYKRPGAYYSHMRFLHPSTFVCDVCGENFLSEAGLALHKKKSLCVPNKDSITDPAVTTALSRHCVECDVTFVSEEAWKRHMVTSDKHNLPYVRVKRRRRKKNNSHNSMQI